ncbi:MAG: serine hydrolase [Eubacteriales bacterium]|nr:serine hydrolase [Eubacteriales bacterium]
MDVTYKRAFDLINGYFLSSETDVAQIPYKPQKTQICNKPTECPFLRTAPELEGFDSMRLASFLHSLESSRTVNVHTVAVLANGKLICEAAAPGYSLGTWHLTHSMCKTLTSLAIGILVDDGKLSLDDKLTSFFGKDVDGKLRTISVKNLLEMNSNVTLGEIASITLENWTDEFCHSQLKADVGSRFAYNSMNSYILGVIVSKVSGVDLFDFLMERLFMPMNIENVFWEKSPEGYSKGGWGLYISTYDMLKIGMLFLDGGKYNGKQIISREYVENATSVHMINQKEDSNYNYGLHIWVNRDGDSFLMNGMLGQNVWICPKNNMIIACTSGNDEIFQSSETINNIEKYFSPKNYTPDAPCSKLKGLKKAKCRILKSAEHDFYKSRTFSAPIKKYTALQKFKSFILRRKLCDIPKEAQALEGKILIPTENNVGLLPIFIRFMQNNHTKGIGSVSFERDGDSLFAVFDEKDEQYRLKIGFTSYEESVIDVHGEKYIVSVLGEFTLSENREKMLKLDIIFPELPNVRKISIYYGDASNIRIKFEEIPGRAMISRLVSGVVGSLPKAIALLSIIKPQFNVEVMKFKILAGFEPTLIASIKDSLSYTDKVDSEKSDKSKNPDTSSEKPGKELILH